MEYANWSREALFMSRLVVLVVIANDILVFADSAGSFAAVSVVPLKTVDWHCNTRLFHLSRMSSIVGLMWRPVAESHCRRGVASASLLGLYLPHKRADAWRFHTATSQPESLATKQICNTPPDIWLLRNILQSGYCGGAFTLPPLFRSKKRATRSHELLQIIQGPHLLSHNVGCANCNACRLLLVRRATK